MIQEETELNKRGYLNIAGVDEAGRGPLAGPVVAAAVILSVDFYHDGIKDSKKLTPKQREFMYEYIIQHACAFEIVSIGPRMIEQMNIAKASLLAMRRAVKKLTTQPDFILVDAFNPQIPEIPQKAIIKGDAKVFCIAAASILAKVTRDRLMMNYHKKYPQYGFADHMGYPTKKHFEALKKHGPCQIHRRTFTPVREALEIQMTLAA